MNEYASIGNGLSFKDFLLKDKRNKRILIFSAIAIVIQFVVFKYLYPYANYIHGDSFEYIDAAANNLTVNEYMIGYSKFLRLFSVFAKPDIALVSFQYLFIECSSLFLLFTIFYFYKAGKTIQTILFCFMVFNPLLLHLGNMVSSDGLFLALSMTWFALLLWIIHNPSNKIIFWHAVVLFIAFTVRYNAMIYPPIAIIAFWLSKMPIRKKIVGLGVGIALCAWFVVLTMFQYKKMTGYWQYAPFSGWQFANNAMYAYRYVDSDDRKPVPEQYRALDNRIRKFYDRTRDLTMNPSEKAMASTFYMWSRGMPLMDYKDSLFKKDTKSTNLKKWATMAPLYKAYGLHIIRLYPLHYLQYFIWPNTRKYFAPPVEFLENYNSGYDRVNDQAKEWFGYNKVQIRTRMEDPKTWILDYYPILSGIINLTMLITIIYFILLKGWRQNEHFKKILFVGAGVWLLNAGFTVTASSAALRFQSFPIILTTILAVLLIDWMAQLMRSIKQAEVQKSEDQFSQELIA